MTLKSSLKAEGVAYSTYNYWSNKVKEESRQLPIAPIEIREGAPSTAAAPAFSGVGIPGVTLAFPNGMRAHFGSGSEKVLMEVLTRSLSHVLPQ